MKEPGQPKKSNLGGLDVKPKKKKALGNSRKINWKTEDCKTQKRTSRKVEEGA